MEGWRRVRARSSPGAVVVLLLATLTACMSEESGQENTSLHDGRWVIGQDGEVVQASELPDSFFARDDLSTEAVPGEGLGGDLEKGDGVGTESHCVIVEWCNEPGAWGTICQISGGCQCGPGGPTGAQWDECRRDARAVCGTVIEPLGFDC
jgi:hypothetical protein